MYRTLSFLRRAAAPAAALAAALPAAPSASLAAAPSTGAEPAPAAPRTWCLYYGGPTNGASGICWEDFAPAHFESDETRSWMEGVAARLAAVRKKNPGFEVLALWVAPPGCGPTSPARASMREKAASFGYRPFVSEGGYQSLPPEAAP